jgi:hypothetical protein
MTTKSETIIDCQKTITKTVSNVLFSYLPKPYGWYPGTNISFGFGLFWIVETRFDSQTNPPVFYLCSFPKSRVIGYRGFDSFEECADYHSNLGNFKYGN